MNGRIVNVLVPAATLLLMQPVVAAPSAEDFAREAPKGIVDCLLPGQLRRIGGQIYQTPQRPARLTASECHIRGGDYLLFDRANYETSLKHWISLAEQGDGDADAMLYVGEIYEQGIGRDPDYEAAAVWYRKAADAGNTTAMISLAHLYKTGAGVPMDLEAAQAMYSQAFGADIPVPLDPTSVKGADQRVQTLLAEVDEVRRQKIAVELELQAASEQLTNARSSLDAALAGDGQATGQFDEMRASIARQQAEISSYRQDLEAIQAENAELQSLRTQLADRTIEVARLKESLAASETSVASYREQLARQKETLDATQADFNKLILAGGGDREALLQRSAELEAQRERIDALETALEKAEDQRDMYQALSSDAATQEERVATLTARIAVLEQKSGGIENDFESTRRDLAATRAKLDEEIASASRAAEASATEISIRDGEIERLRGIVARAEDETGRHRSDIDRLERQSQELMQLRAELEREQAQSNRLQQLLTESQDQYAASNTKLAEAGAAYQKLEAEIAALSEGAAAGDSANETLLRQREDELKAARSVIDSLRASIDSSQDELQQYQLQMADTAERQSMAIQNLRDAVATGRAERVELEERLAAANQQVESAQADLEQERGRYVELQDELRAARVQGEADATALANRQRELDSQTKQVASLQQEIERLTQQSNRYAAEINDLQAVAQAKKIDFVGPKIILAEPSEGGLGGNTTSRGIGVVAAAATSARETRAIRGYIDAPAGLASLVVNGMMVPFDSNNAFAQTIELQGEKTPIRIVARDAKGKEATKEFEFLVGGGAVLKGGTSVAQASRQEPLLQDLRYYALLIANEDYENEDFASDLQTPIADARGIGEILEQRYGFEVEYVFNATTDQMADALERVIYREQKDDDPENDKDAVLVYYAGHGFASRVLGDNLRYFWMPVDAKNNSPRTWYETIEISKYLKESSIPQMMVVADSCYAGNLPSRDGLADVGEPKHSPLYARYVKKRAKMRSRFVFTSGGNEPVLDDGGDGHSVFARELMNVLNDNSTILEAGELKSRVAPRVESASAMLGKEQTPFFGYLDTAGHEFGEFFIPEPLSTAQQAGISDIDDVEISPSSSFAAVDIRP